MATSASPRVSAPVVPGHDVLKLLALAGGRATFTELRLAAAAAFGHAAFYGNCHGDLFDFDGLLRFFEGKGKLARDGDDVILGPVPACSGH
jgi:probable metal-binding protein